jgi:hypothetical protein
MHYFESIKYNLNKINSMEENITDKFHDQEGEIVELKNRKKTYFPKKKTLD